MPEIPRVCAKTLPLRLGFLLVTTALLVVLFPETTMTPLEAQLVQDCPPGETRVDFPAGAISSYVVPADVTAVRVIGVGGHGGDDIDATGSEGTGAQGAGLSAVFTLNPGDTVQVLVGTRGEDGEPEDDGGGGGGGGTFFGVGPDAATAFTPANLLLVAGGGGGGGINFDAGAGGLLDGEDADILTGGHGGLSNGTGGAPGSAGDAGEGGGAAPGSDGADGTDEAGGGGGGGGAGGDGGDSDGASGGVAAVDGGAGGTGEPPLSGDGGFGGGGGGGETGGGGGGGYAGGGGGFNDGGGGGGSSFLAAGATDDSMALVGGFDGIGAICEIRAVPAVGTFMLVTLVLLLVAAALMGVRRRGAAVS